MKAIVIRVEVMLMQIKLFPSSSKPEIKCRFGCGNHLSFKYRNSQSRKIAARDSVKSNGKQKYSGKEVRPISCRVIEKEAVNDLLTEVKMVIRVGRINFFFFL